MKALAALLAAISMTGCVVHIPPGRADVDGHKRGERIIVVCILASCGDIFKPQKQETPTPSPSSRKGESTLEQQASRLVPSVRGKGIGPD
jgi:hypothetical protein